MEQMPCSATAAERAYDGGSYGLTESQIDAEIREQEEDERARMLSRAEMIRITAGQEGYGAGLLLGQLHGQLTERDQNWDDLKPILVAACQRDEREAGRLMVELVERMAQQLAGAE